MSLVLRCEDLKYGSGLKANVVVRAGETFSVDTSITDYRIEHGRRYHAYRDGVYW